MTNKATVSALIVCGHKAALALAIALPVSVTAAACSKANTQAEPYDVVLIGGTVVDPETNLQAVRNVAISGGKIAMVSTNPLRGRTTVNAKVT